MARVVVRGTRPVGNVDPARVWALVADPARIGEWAGVKFVSYMGKEIPERGAAFFATLRPRARAENALRFEITEWEAGHRYRCAITGPGIGDEREVEIAVDSFLASGVPTTELTITHRAQVDRWMSGPYRAMAQRRVEAALDGAERCFGMR